MLNQSALPVAFLLSFDRFLCFFFNSFFCEITENTKAYTDKDATKGLNVVKIELCASFYKRISNPNWCADFLTKIQLCPYNVFSLDV